MRKVWCFQEEAGPPKVSRQWWSVGGVSSSWFCPAMAEPTRRVQIVKDPVFGRPVTEGIAPPPLWQERPYSFQPGRENKIYRRPHVSRQQTDQPIHMSHVWAGHIFKRIHKAPANSSAVVEDARGLSSCLSRWVANTGGPTRDGEFPCAASHESAASSGLDHQPREIGTDPKTGIRFHWNAFQDTGVYGSSPAKDATQVSIYCQPLEAGRDIDCFTLLLARHLADVSCYIGPSMPSGICMEIHTEIVQKRKKKPSHNKGTPRQPHVYL